MTTATITIQLDPEAAQIYSGASSEDKKKLRLLLGLWLREFGIPSKPLKELMDDISARAQARGLTPEILESMLNAA